MPWCEECAKYYTPNSVPRDGSCPSCGDTIQLPESASTPVDIQGEKSPWHFKLMVFTVTVYLAWRVVEVFL